MLTLFHAPQTRSGGVLWLLEELGVAYELERVDISGEDGAPESYRAIHPHKKVPAVIHDGVAITERAAIFAYLADAFPAAGLAPPIGDPRRGPYLSWLIYNDAVIDPLFVARSHGWVYDARGVSFGRIEDMALNLETSPSCNPFLAGTAVTAADILVASSLIFEVRVMKAIPETPKLGDYLSRMAARPAFQTARQKGRS